jgi:hypothetical protein
MPIINNSAFGSIKKYLPSKVIAGMADEISPSEGWLYDDGMNDPWWQGAGAAPYRWILNATIDASTHSSHLTREPFVYNGLDIIPGMWVFSTFDAKAVKVRGILSKTASTIQCIVEDVDRYNTFKDVSSAGNGIFSSGASVIFFQLGDDGLPVLDPLPATASDPSVISQVEARFRVFNPTFEYKFYQVDHGFTQGAVLKIDPMTRQFAHATSNDIYIVGTVVSTGPGPNYFYLAPSTKFISNLEPGLPGTAGSIIWIDPDTGSTTITPNGSKAPLYIQMTDPLPTYTIGNVDSPVSWDGISFTINKTKIELSGPEPIELPAIRLAINAKTNEHNVIAANGSPANVVVGTVEFPSAPVPPSGHIIFMLNGEEVSIAPPSVTFGDSGTVGWWDFVREINERTHLHGVWVKVDPDSGVMTFTNSSGGGINFVNMGDDEFTTIVGVNPNNPPAAATRLKLIRPDGGDIVVSNIAGDFTSDMGIQSSANGRLPLALVVDASIGATNNYVVTDIAARDELADLRTGDQVFVQSAEDSEWALFVRTGDAWTKLSDFDSARSDANTMTAEVTHSSPSSVLVGTISDGCRVLNVTVQVLEAFDGGGASLSVGTGTDQSILISDDILDLSKVGSYESNTSYTYEGVEEGQVVLYLDTQGSTTGKAKIIVSYM